MTDASAKTCLSNSRVIFPSFNAYHYCYYPDNQLHVDDSLFLLVFLNFLISFLNSCVISFLNSCVISFLNSCLINFLNMILDLVILIFYVYLSVFSGFITAVLA